MTYFLLVCLIAKKECTWNRVKDLPLLYIRENVIPLLHCLHRRLQR
jgi:hypothetical protein